MSRGLEKEPAKEPSSVRGGKKSSSAKSPPTAGPFHRGGSREWSQKLPRCQEDKGKEACTGFNSSSVIGDADGGCFCREVGEEASGQEISGRKERAERTVLWGILSVKYRREIQRC